MFSGGGKKETGDPGGQWKGNEEFIITEKK